MAISHPVRRTACRFFIVASATALCACAVGITRLYTGARSPDEVSVIVWDPSAAARFEKVDGTVLPQNVMRVQRVEFLPGSHTFAVRVPGENGNTQIATITQTTSPGRCYRLGNETMVVSVEVNGRVAAPKQLVPVLHDTTAAACPTR